MHAVQKSSSYLFPSTRFLGITIFMLCNCGLAGDALCQIIRSRMWYDQGHVGGGDAFATASSLRRVLWAPEQKARQCLPPASMWSNHHFLFCYTSSFHSLWRWYYPMHQSFTIVVRAEVFHFLWLSFTFRGECCNDTKCFSSTYYVMVKYNEMQSNCSQAALMDLSPTSVTAKRTRRHYMTFKQWQSIKSNKIPNSGAPWFSGRNYRYRASLGGPKTGKCDILRVFWKDTA